MAKVSILAQVADMAASQAAGSASPLMPSGTILPYGGATTPVGWIICNGQALSRITYANLFAVLGVIHGQGDGSTTFNVPDLRGRFMRGTDTMGGLTASRDPDKALRTAANTGGNTGDNVGSVQVNATAKNGLVQSGGTASLTSTTTFSSDGHNHYEGDLKAAIGATGGDAGSIGYTATSPQARGPSSVGSYTVFGTSNTSASRSYNHYTPVYGTTGGNNQAASVGISSTAASLSTGDNETRPINININYIIKI